MAPTRNNRRVPVRLYMAEIDPELAMEWSFQHGHRYDDDVRQAQARDAGRDRCPGALAMLNQKLDAESQRVLQELAERFAETDPKKAMLFAEEAAVQARAESARPDDGDGPGRRCPGQAGPGRRRPQADRRGGPRRCAARYRRTALAITARSSPGHWPRSI